VLCLELQNVLQQVASNIELLPAVMHTTIPTATLGQKYVTAAPLESSLLSISGLGESGQHDTPSLQSHQMVQQGGSPHITVERKILTRIHRDERKDSSHPERASKKKRRKVARNDIDDIFGS